MGGMVKAAAIVQLIEKEEGVTQKWLKNGENQWKDGRMHLVFEVGDITERGECSEFYTRRNVPILASRYPKFKEDLARELAMHRTLFELLKLRMESNLSKAEYAKKWGLSERTFHGWKRGRSIQIIYTLINSAPKWI